MFKTILGHYIKNKLTDAEGKVIIACPYSTDVQNIENKKGFFLVKTFNLDEDIDSAKSVIIVDYLLTD